MMDKYYLLLLNDPQGSRRNFPVCGTYREGTDDPKELRSSAAHVRVDVADYRLAQEPGEWQFSSKRGLYKA